MRQKYPINKPMKLILTHYSFLWSICMYVKWAKPAFESIYNMGCNETIRDVITLQIPTPSFKLKTKRGKSQMLNEGLDLKLWWTNLQIDATASSYMLLLSLWSLLLCSSGTKGKTGHGCMDRLPSLWQWLQLLLSSGTHGSAKGWGWQGFSYPCCQPHSMMNTKKTDRQTTMASMETFLLPLQSHQSQEQNTEITQPMHLWSQRWGNPADKQIIKQLSNDGNDPM